MKHLILMFLIFSGSCFAQIRLMPISHSGGAGNGGDYVRMKFIEVGNFILQNYKENLKEISDQVSIQDLRATLDINFLHVSTTPVLDNRGNPVDAIGEKSKIILFSGEARKDTGWYGIFKRGDLVEKLVLHEMLRSSGVNDDNYVWSSRVIKKYDLNHFDDAAYIRWCSESASFIEAALTQGLYSKTHEQEIKLYEETLAQIEGLISPKHFYFVKSSIEGALRSIQFFKSDLKRVRFLKLVLTQLGRDIRYIDTLLKNKNSQSTNALGDHSIHASRYLEVASRYTLLAESNEAEIQLLNIIFEQVYSYMINSDYARVKYSALFAELDSASNTPVLTYKRKSLNYLQTLLR